MSGSAVLAFGCAATSSLLHAATFDGIEATSGFCRKNPALLLQSSSKPTFSLFLDLLHESTNSPFPRSWEFHVAPMQGYTSLPLRILFAFLTPSVDDDFNAIRLWTEMEKVDDLLGADKDGWKRRLGPSAVDARSYTNKGCRGVILQLGGSDPILIKKCIQKAKEYGYGPNDFVGVNLNCGCPSIEAGGAATFGASLMRKPELSRDLVAAVCEAIDVYGGDASNIEVSVKTRISVLDSLEDLADTQEGDVPWHLDEEEYASLYHYLHKIQSGGAEHVVLHARPAILAGLSPVKNRQVPKLDYGAVERAARDFPGMRFTLNGGITSLTDLESMFNADSGLNQFEGRFASHMAGRWMLRRPLDLALVYLKQQQLNSDDGSIRARALDELAVGAVERYIAYAQKTIDLNDQATPTIPEVLLPLYLVVEQLREDYDLYGEINCMTTCTSRTCSLQAIEEMYDIILLGITTLSSTRGKKCKLSSADSINFKKLAGAFKSIVGTKVVNKWKRNRAEL